MIRFLPLKNRVAVFLIVISALGLAQLGWSLEDLDGDGDLERYGDLDAFIAHGQVGLSQGGGLPNEVWWNEIP